MVTVPLPDVRPNQPITRIIDANVYVRHERGGLMLDAQWETRAYAVLGLAQRADSVAVARNAAVE